MFYFLAAFATILLAVICYVVRLGNKQHALLRRMHPSFPAGDKCLQEP